MPGVDFFVVSGEGMGVVAPNLVAGDFCTVKPGLDFHILVDVFPKAAAHADVVHLEIRKYVLDGLSYTFVINLVGRIDVENVCVGTASNGVHLGEFPVQSLGDF